MSVKLTFDNIAIDAFAGAGAPDEISATFWFYFEAAGD